MVGGNENGLLTIGSTWGSFSLCGVLGEFSFCFSIRKELLGVLFGLVSLFILIFGVMGSAVFGVSDLREVS